MSNFKLTLSQGKTGETEIANWLMNRGNHILPIYEIAENQFKGPSLYASDGSDVIAPDMLVFSNGVIRFIEAKHKNAFSWYRTKGIWTTGIDKKHFYEYLKIRELLDIPVWILFLHKGGTAKDSPPSPAGLYGNDIDILRNCIDHESDKHGLYGMVYWNKDSLKYLADYPLSLEQAA